MKLPVDTIDNICEGKAVSIIKKDVEGSEYMALKGGAKTIADNKPLLMVCVYHKRDDMFILKDYIDSLTNGYTFYLRAHNPFPLDVVLYAVPEHRAIK